MVKNRLLTRISGALVCGSLLAIGASLELPKAQATCGDDRPCFDKIYMEEPNTLVATWHLGGRYSDFYQVRYSSPGGPEPQAKVEVSANPTYRIYEATPGATYTLKVQGCEQDIW